MDELYLPKENARTAFYRKHQSAYRENVLPRLAKLKVPPGKDRNGRSIGSLLPKDETKSKAGLNFFCENDVVEYVKERVAQVKEEQGTLDEDRLWRNMLSSMPLCFNLFGYLRKHPEITAAVMNGVLGIDIAEVTEIEVEKTPGPKKDYLDDRTAFDAFIQYRSSSGKTGFLGIETKYTDSFGRQKVSDPNRYSKVAKQTGIATEIPDASELQNQVWRNTLLAAAVRHKPAWDEGFSVVISLADDDEALRSMAAVRAKLKDRTFLRWTSYEAIVAELEQTDIAPWAKKFRQRYLPPVFGHR